MMRFATDTGGTFTDLLIEDEVGSIYMFKAATVPSEPVRGVLAAFDVAAKHFQINRRTLLSRGEMFVHGFAKAAASSRLITRFRIRIPIFRAR